LRHHLIGDRLNSIRHGIKLDDLIDQAVPVRKIGLEQSCGDGLSLEKAAILAWAICAPVTQNTGVGMTVYLDERTEPTQGMRLESPKLFLQRVHKNVRVSNPVTLACEDDRAA
jgi:hypothetical protein